jgi:hypothetical protein
MSNLLDRRTSILGRRRSGDTAPKPKPTRTARAAKPAFTVDPGDPQAWRGFKPNTLAYARLWLQTGALPAETHFVIRERLAPWIAAVQVGGDELRAELLAVVLAIEPRVPLPSRDWIMPKRAHEPAEVAPLDTAEITSEEPQEISSFSGSHPVNPPPPANDTGSAFSRGPTSAERDFPEDQLKREVLADPAEIRKRRRGYQSVFEAEFWGEAPKKLPAYPPYPTGRVSGITLATYRAKLLPAILARTAPPLLPAKVALTALKIDKKLPDEFDPRPARRPAWWPKWLPVARQDGEWWVERDELREHLFPKEYLGPRPACPIAVPRCRHCGRLSHHGWADQICGHCEDIRTSIETRQMTRFSIAERRGWKGPPLITDDELLLAVQSRLAAQDRAEWAAWEKEERREAKDKRRAKKDYGKLEDLDEAA